MGLRKCDVYVTKRIVLQTCPWRSATPPNRSRKRADLREVEPWARLPRQAAAVESDCSGRTKPKPPPEDPSSSVPGIQSLGLPQWALKRAVDLVLLEVLKFLKGQKLGLALFLVFLPWILAHTAHVMTRTLKKPLRFFYSIKYFDNHFSSSLTFLSRAKTVSKNRNFLIVN